LENGQGRPERLERGRQATESQPGLGVGDAGGPERRQVAPDEVGQGETGRGRGQSIVHRRQRRLAAPAPQTARRQLQHWQMNARRHRQSLRIAPRPARGQGVAKLGRGQRPAPQQLARRRRDLDLIQPGQGATMNAAFGQKPVQTALDQRSDRREVVGCGDVQRAAHQRAARQAEILQQCGQVLRREGLQPGPEREIRRRGGLGLQGDQPLERLGHGKIGAAQEVLPRQQRPVQRPSIQDLHHGVPVPPATCPLSASGAAKLTL
jgi:hypothetical protein